MELLVNANIHELNPYKPGKPIEEIQRKYNLEKVIKLASNENPFPIPDRVAAVIKDEMEMLNFYPDSESYYLREQIARYNGVGIKNVIVGAGSSEIIKMIMKSFLKPGEKVLTSEKTFLMYRVATIEQLGKQGLVEIKMDSQYRFDLDQMLEVMDEQAKVICIANPNNPTGTLLPREKLLDFIDKIPPDKIIVLDNAYHEYVSQPGDYLTGIDMAVSRKNLIVLRTFSKIYALAGLRVGYAIANEDIIYYLNKVRSPFNVTRISQRAAMASLEDDDFKNKSAKLNLKNKKALYARLEAVGLNPIASETNFIMFFPGVDIGELNRRLLMEGVIVRPLQAFDVADAMRVTVGREEDNEYFIHKLRKVLGEMK